MNPFLALFGAYLAAQAAWLEAVAVGYRDMEKALDRIAGDAWEEDRRAMPPPRQSRVVLGEENVIPFPRRSA